MSRPKNTSNTTDASKASKTPFGSLNKFIKSEDPTLSLIRDILCVVVIVGLIAAGLYAFSGTWPAVVAIESQSMVPNMNVGDLVFVVAPDRYGELMTWTDGEQTGYAKYNSSPDKQGNQVFGDVIIYRPNGNANVHPIIHRAITWHEKNESIIGDSSGYITKGDNNIAYDQISYLSSVGKVKPVEKNWVIGKAFFAIPYVGYAPLHIFEFALLLIGLLVIHELYVRHRDKKKESNKSQSQSQSKSQSQNHVKSSKKR